MRDDFDPTGIACSLTTAELRDRKITLFAQFRSAVLETKEFEEGYAFHLSGNDESICLVAQFILAERECCPFLTFEVTALPTMGPVILRITGATGTKEFLKTTLMSATSPEAAASNPNPESDGPGTGTA